MQHLQARRMTLNFIPDVIQRDFEHMVLSSYFEEGAHTVEEITSLVDIFAIHALSYEETGDPFTYINDDAFMELHVLDGIVLEDNDFDIMMDVTEVLDYHRCFHTSRMTDIAHQPIVEVW